MFLLGQFWVNKTTLFWGEWNVHYRIRKMVSFELGKERERDGFRLATSMGQRKNSEYPWGIEPQTLGFRAPMLYHWATDSTVGEVYFEFEVHVTRVPHTAKISNVDRVMFVNRIGEMVVFYSWHERGIKNIFLYRAQNLSFLLFYLQTWTS